VADAAAAAGATATAAAAARTTVVSGFVACLDAEEFLKALAAAGSARSPIVHGVLGLVWKKHIYAFSINGLVIVYCGEEPLPVTPDIEARRVEFPASWRCC